jgi:phage baseplate assembly protein gpV
MQNGRIKLSTGGSSLELAGDNATLSANAEINLAAGSAIHLRAPLVTIEADAVEIRGTGIIQVDGGGLVTITGGMVKVNGGVVTEN